jgi:hypothetical protein
MEDEPGGDAVLGGQRVGFTAARGQ